MLLSSTIFALATPPGKSALAVIRISGPRAHAAAPLFGVSLKKARQVQRASLVAQDGAFLDDVLILTFSSPASSTGEDVLEIQCHGSQAVVSGILDVLEKHVEFRLAEPGEFTRRALENGKIDVAQAEGLADLIDAETSLQRQQAAAQMRGTLSKPVSSWREDIIYLSAMLEALIDFADEDLPSETLDNIFHKRQNVIDSLGEVLSRGTKGELVRNGLTAALVGPVNAGKSTTLNVLTGRSAAIVSDIAGTTRDVLETKIEVNGIPLTLFDTAGLRDATEEIELEGIRRAEERARDADILIIVVDGSQAGWPAMVASLSQWASEKCLIIVNKSDRGLVKGDIISSVPYLISYVSMTDPAAAVTIEAQLGQLAPEINYDSGSALITRARHRTAFQTAYDHLCRSKERDIETESELVAEEFRAATAALGRITGHVEVDDILDSIFSRFCIGK